MIRFLTAGESHGKCLTAIIEGLPSNLGINIEKINAKLAQRQKGHGRGGRMKIETDKAEILSGVRDGKTLGSPVAVKIENKDWENWKNAMSPEEAVNIEKITAPRPGHADLSGIIKYDFDDARNVLERASARETAARVAVGSVCIQLLEEFGISIYSHVVDIGGIKSESNFEKALYVYRMEESLLRCIDEQNEKKMIELIDKASTDGDSLGGIFEIIISGLPAGLGSHVHWDRKLDAKLAYSILSIQAVKGIEFGKGFKTSETKGSEYQDEILYEKGMGYHHNTNNAGGIEGGMSNGEDIVFRAVMKPIPTLMTPLQTVDINTKEIKKAVVERSDVCAVPAASIVGECVAAYVIASELVEKFAGDSISEMKTNYKRYIEYVKER